MASSTDKQRTIAGQMSLLPPTDKIDSTNALMLRNFRVDSVNKLMCRGGSVLEFGPVGTGTFHTIAHGQGYIYNGIGKELYFGRLADALVSGGFDGGPIGIVSYLGNAYAMNPGKQLRLNDERSWAWTQAPPATAPIATGGGQLINVLETYDGGDGANTVIAAGPGLDPIAPNNVAMQGDAATPSDANPSYVDPTFDPLNKMEGAASLALTINQGCTVSAVVNPLNPLDSTFSGIADDNDSFQVWIRCTDPSQVISFSLSMHDNANGYVEVNFQANPAYGGTFFPPAKFLSQVPGGWTLLKIKRSVNLDDWAARVAAVVANPPDQTAVSDIESQYASAVSSPAFAYVGTGSPQTGLPVPPVTASQLPFNWASITSISVNFVTAGAVQINLDALQVIGTVSANVTGSINYFVSFFNNSNQDTNPSPASNAVISGDQSITLTNIPISPDPQTAGRYIWRIGGGISQALQVGIIWDNVSTGPWTDPTSNADAQDNGVQMPINRDPAPPAKIVIGPYYGKMVAFNTADHPSRMFWTPTGQPWFFPGSNDDLEGNWEDVGGDDDEVLAVIQHPGLLVIYKERSIWRLQGDPQTNDPQQTHSNMGISGLQMAVNAGTEDYIGSSEGIYVFNLDFAQKVSDTIDPLFKGDFTYLGGTQLLVPINPDKLGASVLSIAGQDRLRFSYASWYSSTLDTVLIYHIPSKRWEIETYDGLPAPAFTAMTYGGNNRDGLVRTMMAGVTAPNGFTGMGSIGGGYCYRIEQVNITTDDGNPIQMEWVTPFMDEGLPENFKWYSDLELECGPGLKFDHGVTYHVSLRLDNGTREYDLGSVTTGLVKGIQYFKLQGDEALGIPAETAAAMETPYGLRAKNWQVRITCSVPFGGAELYGLYMHFYPEERQASTFDSGFTNFGLPERDKQVDYLELYVTSNGGNAQIQIASDLPSSLLSYRPGWPDEPLPIGRGNVRFRLPEESQPLEGRNFRFQVNNENGVLMQVHQARLRMRPIGEYIDGTIGEYYESPQFSVMPGRVGELKDFLLDYDVSGPGGSFVLYSDLPNEGQGLQIRRTIDIPYNSGVRRIATFPLEDSAFDLPAGQLFKVRLYPPAGGILRLHGRAQFRASLLSVYFNGANGEIWESQAVPLFGGVALLREASIISKTTGPVLFQVLEDLPNNLFRVLGSMTVNTAVAPDFCPTYGRFPGSTKGHQIKCRITGSAIVKLYEVRLYGRRLWTDDPGWSWTQINLQGQPGGNDGAGTGQSGNFTLIDMPVRQTPAEFTWVDLPVDSTG